MVIFKIDVYLQRIKRSFFDLYSILINNKLPSFHHKKFFTKNK